MFSTNSKLLSNSVWKVWYLITLLKSSGLGGIRVHVKAIRIIMKKFQRQYSNVQDTPYIVYLSGSEIGINALIQEGLCAAGLIHRVTQVVLYLKAHVCYISMHHQREPFRYIRILNIKTMAPVAVSQGQPQSLRTSHTPICNGERVLIKYSLYCKKQLYLYGQDSNVIRVRRSVSRKGLPPSREMHPTAHENTANEQEGYNGKYPSYTRSSPNDRLHHRYENTPSSTLSSPIPCLENEMEMAKKIWPKLSKMSN